MGQIIAIANQKGGVGKTTVTVHLAAWLSREGYRIVVIDADPQGNLTSWLLSNLDHNGLYNLLIKKETLKKSLIAINGWNLALLPGNTTTSEALTILAALGRPFDTIAKAIHPLTDLADYVLIDMPPSRSTGFLQLLYSTHWVLVPSTMERLSIEGVSLMAQAAQLLATEHGHGPRLLGIVPNMVRRTVEHKEYLKQLDRMYGAIVWPPIPQSIAVSEACSYGETLFTHAPHNPATEAMTDMCQRFEQNLL